MSVHYLLFGATPELSRLEWTSVYPQIPLTHLSARLSQIDWPDLDSADQLVAQLGGLVKVLRAEETLVAKNQPELYNQVADYLETHQSKPEFSLVEYGHSKVGQLSPQVLKNALKDKGLSARFIRQSSPEGLSAAVLLHQKRVIELNLIHTPETIVLAKTLAVQDIDDWTVRDRSKPYADHKKGMLPPKVARMMVNIGLGDRRDVLMYDPFCGTGTTLMEAALLGAQVMGSDLDATSIAGAEANLQWLAETYPRAASAVANAKLKVADATHVSWPELPQKVDVIVTEPFLGKPKPQPAFLKNMFRGLEKLYLGTLKNWTSLLKPGAKIVMVWPMVQTEKHTYSLEHLIDKLGVWGYTLQVNPPVTYARPFAIVQRQIVVLTWQPPQGGTTN